MKPMNHSRTSVITREISSDGTHPARLEKNKNIRYLAGTRSAASHILTLPVGLDPL
jgi:hypothetical protein